jgi:hypothetical protein
MKKEYKINENNTANSLSSLGLATFFTGLVSMIVFWIYSLFVEGWGLFGVKVFIFSLPIGMILLFH